MRPAYKTLGGSKNEVPPLTGFRIQGFRVEVAMLDSPPYKGLLYLGVHIWGPVPLNENPQSM